MTSFLMAESENRGIQAYRWFVTIGVACVGYFAYDTRDVMQKSADKLNSLSSQVSVLSATVESRFTAQSDRLRSLDDKNLQQDARMDRLSGKLEDIARQIYQGFRQYPQVTP